MRKNVAGQKFYFSLFKSGARIANPTRAAGDFTVSVGGIGQVNVNTLPTTDAAGLCVWSPTQAETNADYVIFLANDAAGSEWEPLMAEFLTTPETSIESILDDTGTSGVVSVTGNVGGNVTGSVGSVAGNVTGSVGSVTGNVAGNVVGSVGSVAGNVTGSVGSVAAGGIVPASFAANAIDANALATSATDEITDSVWAEQLPGAYLAGSAGYILGNLIASITASATFLSAMAAAVWSYVSRTITSGAVAVTSSDMVNTNLNVHRGDTWSFGITGLGDITLRTKLWFTVKESADDTDAIAQILITETGGLLYVNGAAYGTPAHGSITVTNAVLGSVTIYVHETATAMLAANHARFWDMQVKLPTGVYTRGQGDVDMTRDITRATV